MPRKTPVTAMLTFAVFSALATATTVASAANALVLSLCDKPEQTVWSCTAGRQVYSVCASPTVTANSGYVQYRAGMPGNVEFRFPAGKQHPLGHFGYVVLANGASLGFNNGGYVYVINEPLTGQTTISVTTPNGDTQNMPCRTSTHSLGNTITIDLFKAAGVAR
jgi:hypothetical protein